MSKDTRPKVRFVEVSAEEEGQRIDNYLMKTLKGVPKSRIYKMLRKGEVRVNKGRIKAEYKIEAMKSAGITISKSPADIGKTLFEKLKA